MLSGGKPGPHPIQGIGAGFVPDVYERQKAVVDEVIQCTGADAIAMARKMSVVDGLMVGPSSGAAVKVAADIASRPENKGKMIVCIIPSFGCVCFSPFCHFASCMRRGQAAPFSVRLCLPATLCFGDHASAAADRGGAFR